MAVHVEHRLPSGGTGVEDEPELPATLVVRDPLSDAGHVGEHLWGRRG